MTGCYRFDRFSLDVADRRLTRDGEEVELNARYLDALALLVSEAGSLVSKDRFMDEVWRGIPVTDEALTQCIRTLRRQLGDDAASPRFIQTVPKHGYRFVALVEPVDANGAAASPAHSANRARLLELGVAGAFGGSIAGIVGGSMYGLAAASQPAVGSLSVLFVLVAVTTLISTIGAAGVALKLRSRGSVPDARPVGSRPAAGSAG